MYVDDVLYFSVKKSVQHFWIFLKKGLFITFSYKYSGSSTFIMLCDNDKEYCIEPLSRKEKLVSS